MNMYKHITGGTTNPLINKFTTGGEVDTSEPPKQYAETSLERVQNYSVNTDPEAVGYIRDYLGKSNKIYPEGETSEAKKKRMESMSFLRSWYTHPTTQQMMAVNDHRDYEQGVRSSNGKEITYPEDARKLITVATLSNTPVEYTNLGDRTLGRHVFTSYDPAKNKVQINPNFSTSLGLTFTHEYDHALQKAIPGITRPTQKFEHKLKPGIIKDSYLDSPAEIRSRIMEFRQYHKLTPDKRNYTPEEAAEMQKKTEGMEGYLGGVADLNRLDPETLANYLNFMASTNTDKSKPTYEKKVYAKKGGIINKH